MQGNVQSREDICCVAVLHLLQNPSEKRELNNKVDLLSILASRCQFLRHSCWLRIRVWCWVKVLKRSFLNAYENISWYINTCTNNLCKVSNFRSLIIPHQEVNLILNWKSPIPAGNISVFAWNMGKSQVVTALKPRVFLVLSKQAQQLLLMCQNRESSLRDGIWQHCLPLSGCWLLKTMYSLCTFLSAVWLSSFLGGIISWLYTQWYKGACRSGSEPWSLAGGYQSTRKVTCSIQCKGRVQICFLLSYFKDPQQLEKDCSWTSIK